MGNTASRERILSSIRSALANEKTSMPFPEEEVHQRTDFIKTDASLAEQYAVEFTKQQGRFVYCENHDDLLRQLLMLADNLNWKKIACKDSKLISLFGESNISIVHPDYELNECQAAISLCERLVARTGSAVYSSMQASGRKLPIATPIHITIAYTSQLVYDWQDAVAAIQQKYDGKLPSMLSLTTGPSRTADIEKTLVIGVHGPKEVYTFLVEG